MQEFSLSNITLFLRKTLKGLFVSSNWRFRFAFLKVKSDELKVNAKNYYQIMFSIVEMKSNEMKNKYSTINLVAQYLNKSGSNYNSNPYFSPLASFGAHFTINTYMFNF